MPYVVVQDSSRCPTGRPWAVKKQGTDKTFGCHPSKAAALKQSAALYANVPDAREDTFLSSEWPHGCRCSRCNREFSEGDSMSWAPWNENAVTPVCEQCRSAAPAPPNLRIAEPGAMERCGSCKMFDHDKSTCWGYGNVHVQPTQVCDSYSPEPVAGGARAGTEVQRMSLTAPALTSHTHDWRRERALSLSETQRKRTETRQANAPLELREGAEQGKRLLRSYASLFNEPYTVRSGGYRFEEVIRPGAFRRTLGTKPDVVFRTEHSGPPLAATWSGDLRLDEDSLGLRYEVDLDEKDPDVQAFISKVERGVYRESSFAFRVPREGDRWNEEHDKREVMTCELDRGDVSVVTFGASRGTANHMILRSEEALLALQELGFERVLAAFAEWRNFTLLPREERLGKVISSTSMETLRQVLGLIADADDAVDEAEAMLADFMGVPNPDEDEQNGYDEDGEEGGSPTSSEQLGKLGRSEEGDLYYDGEDEDRKALTTKARNGLPSSAFVFPKEREYPIHDISHARNALARASGKPEEATVKRAVYRRYPSLKPSAKRCELVANDDDLSIRLRLRSVS